MPRGSLTKFRHPYLSLVLKQLRTDQSLTQRDVATGARDHGGSLTPEYYSECERGNRQPSVESLAWILLGLNVTVDEFASQLQTASSQSYPKVDNTAIDGLLDLVRDRYAGFIQTAEPAPPMLIVDVYQQLSPSHQRIVNQMIQSFAAEDGIDYKP